MKKLYMVFICLFISMPMHAAMRGMLKKMQYATQHVHCTELPKSVKTKKFSFKKSKIIRAIGSIGVGSGTYVLYTYFDLYDKPLFEGNDYVNAQVYYDRFHKMVLHKELPEIQYDAESAKYSFKGKELIFRVKKLDDCHGLTIKFLNKYFIYIDYGISPEQFDFTIRHEVSHVFDMARIIASNRRYIPFGLLVTYNALKSKSTKELFPAVVAQKLCAYANEHSADKRAIFSPSISLKRLESYLGAYTDIDAYKKRCSEIENYYATRWIVDIDSSARFSYASDEQKALWAIEAIEWRVNNPGKPYPIENGQENVKMDDELESLRRYACRRYNPRNQDEKIMRNAFCNHYDTLLEIIGYSAQKERSVTIQDRKK